MKENFRNSTISWLAKMSDKEFVEFIYEIIKERPPTSEILDEQGHFILGNATFDRDDKMWVLDLIGVHDPDQYSNGFEKNVLICQFGECTSCGSEVSSWAKHAKCPVCGEKVYCT